VSFSGLINLADIGLPWEPDTELDVVCERLWDVARMAYVNLEHPPNYSAAHWYEDQTEISLPIDTRALRDKAVPKPSNVIKYRRRSKPPVLSPPSIREPSEDVMFIGDDVPMIDPNGNRQNDDSHDGNSNKGNDDPGIQFLE